MLDAVALRAQLHGLQPCLCELTGLHAIESQITSQGPVSVDYKWNGMGKEERFLLSVVYSPLELKISMLWLPRSMRNKGLGTKILDQLFQIAKQHGIPKAMLETRPGSEGFWTKAGFAPDRHSYWKCELS